MSKAWSPVLLWCSTPEGIGAVCGVPLAKVITLSGTCSTPEGIGAVCGVLPEYGRSAGT